MTTAKVSSRPRVCNSSRLTDWTSLYYGGYYLKLSICELKSVEEWHGDRLSDLTTRSERPRHDAKYSEPGYPTRSQFFNETVFMEFKFTK